MHFDAIVVGGGAVGASVARALRGLSVALVAGARNAPSLNPASADFDARVYALSPGSVEFLRSLKAWDAIDPKRLTPVHAMRIYGDAPGAQLEMDAYKAGVAELAWIVEDRALQDAFWSALGTQDGLEICAPAQCVSIELGDCARIRLSDGRTLEADLVVGADGADSFVRSAAGIPARQASYGQTSIVANFASEAGHGQVASQWFQGGAVLALLPLPAKQVSMVWSVPDAQAAHLLALDGDSLAKEVSAASRSALGEMRLVSTVHAFALRRLTADCMCKPHLALAGDAAHVIHPLAGQGLNLGLQDAKSLGNFVTRREPVRSPGDFALLRRYERDRSEAILAMSFVVHGLYSLFGSRGSTAGRMRNLGLNFTDRAPVLKNALLRHALQ